MGAPEIQAFLAHLATEGNVSASTQNQALSALLFLHKEIGPVLLPSAKRPQRLSTVLTWDEVLWQYLFPAPRRSVDPCGGKGAVTT